MNLKQKIFFGGLVLMLVFSSFLPIINLKNQAEAVSGSWDIVDIPLGLGAGTSMVADGEGKMYVSYFDVGVPYIKYIDTATIGDIWHVMTAPVCSPTSMVPLKLGIDYLADEPGEYLYAMYPVGAGGVEVQKNQWDFISNPWLAFWASVPTDTTYLYNIASNPTSGEVFIAHALDGTGTIRVSGVISGDVDLVTGGVVSDFIIKSDSLSPSSFYLAVLDLTGSLAAYYYDGASFFVYGLPDVGSANNISMAVADDGTLYVLAEYGAAEDLIFVKRPGIIGWEYFSFSSTSANGNIYIDSEDRIVVGYNDTSYNKLVVKRSLSPYSWGIDPVFEYLGSSEGISSGLISDINIAEPILGGLYIGATDTIGLLNYPIVKKWTETTTGRSRFVDVVVTDITPPSPVSKITSTKFAYSDGQDLVINWQKPIDTDLSSTNIYRFNNACPANLSSLTLDTNSLLTQTRANTQAILDSSISDINQAYCYVFQTEDTSSNKSILVSYEVIPAQAKNIFSSLITGPDNNSATTQEEDINTKTATSSSTSAVANPVSQIIYDLVEAPKAYDSKTQSLGLMNYLRGKFLLLIEPGYPANLYYVNPNETYPHRYTLTWKTVIDSFSKLSIGITHENLIKIPTCDTNERSNPLNFKNPVLLLDVNQGGEIWYYNQNCRQSITWKNMWDVLPKQALGINLQNLNKIPFGEIN